MKGAASLLSSAFWSGVVARAWSPRNSMLRGRGGGKVGGGGVECMSEGAGVGMCGPGSERA